MVRCDRQQWVGNRKTDWLVERYRDLPAKSTGGENPVDAVLAAQRNSQEWHGHLGRESRAGSPCYVPRITGWKPVPRVPQNMTDRALRGLPPAPPADGNAESAQQRPDDEGAGLGDGINADVVKCWAARGRGIIQAGELQTGGSCQRDHVTRLLDPTHVGAIVTRNIERDCIHHCSAPRHLKSLDWRITGGGITSEPKRQGINLAGHRDKVLINGTRGTAVHIHRLGTFLGCPTRAVDQIDRAGRNRPRAKCLSRRVFGASTTGSDGGLEAAIGDDGCPGPRRAETNATRATANTNQPMRRFISVLLHSLRPKATTYKC